MDQKNDDARINLIVSAFNNCCKTRHKSKHIQKYARKTAPRIESKKVEFIKIPPKLTPCQNVKAMKEKCPYCNCTIKTRTEEALIKHYTHCSMFFD